MTEAVHWGGAAELIISTLFKKWKPCIHGDTEFSDAYATGAPSIG
jgi:hypothetical protein